MILIHPSVQIIQSPDEKEAYQLIQLIARTCYKSQDKITDDSCYKFVNMLLNEKRHLAMAEFFDITVKFIVDRGISHQLVRHRLCSFAQQSTRYCNYSKKNEGQLTFVIPHWLNLKQGQYNDIQSLDVNKKQYRWLLSNKQSQDNYLYMLSNGMSPQDARSVLTHSIKTQIVVKANLRQWMTIFEQRTSLQAHPDMRKIMMILYRQIAHKYSNIKM